MGDGHRRPLRADVEAGDRAVRTAPRARGQPRRLRGRGTRLADPAGRNGSRSASASSRSWARARSRSSCSSRTECRNCQAARSCSSPASRSPRHSLSPSARRSRLASRSPSACRGASTADIAASALLCAVLGITGALLRRYRLSQEATELLLARLEDARDDQARAAAAEERASIARELHDVLAHSLSGLSIQLEMVRKVAGKEDAPAELRAAIDGAADLAKQGLAEARDAVGALRRDDRLGIDQLPELVAHFRRDFNLAVAYSVAGTPRPVAPELRPRPLPGGRRVAHERRTARRGCERARRALLRRGDGQAGGDRQRRIAERAGRRGQLAGGSRACASGSSGSAATSSPGRRGRDGRSSRARRHDRGRDPARGDRRRPASRP